MRPFNFSYIRHSSIGMVGMLAILLIASLAISASLIVDSLRKGEPAKPTAQRLVTANGAVKFDEFGQPMWWSAPITVVDKNLTVSMRSSLDSQTLTVGMEPGIILAYIDSEGRVAFEEPTDVASMPDWWPKFKQEIQQYDWLPIFHQAKEANLLAFVTSAHTRTCKPGVNDKTVYVCEPTHGGDSVYVYKLQPGQP